MYSPSWLHRGAAGNGGTNLVLFPKTGGNVDFIFVRLYFYIVDDFKFHFCFKVSWNTFDDTLQLFVSILLMGYLLEVKREWLLTI